MERDALRRDLMIVTKTKVCTPFTVRKRVAADCHKGQTGHIFQVSPPEVGVPGGSCQKLQMNGLVFVTACLHFADHGAQIRQPAVATQVRIIFDQVDAATVHTQFYRL